MKLNHHSETFATTRLGKLICLILVTMISTIVLMGILSITDNQAYGQKLGLLNNLLITQCGAFILLLLSAFYRGILK